MRGRVFNVFSFGEMRKEDRPTVSTVGYFLSPSPAGKLHFSSSVFIPVYPWLK